MCSWVKRSTVGHPGAPRVSVDGSSSGSRPRLYEIPEKFPVRYIVRMVPQRPPYPGVSKSQLYPTNPAPMMLYKVLRFMAGVGFVECAGLIGDFFRRPIR
jgi:hypothetical protein